MDLNKMRAKQQAKGINPKAVNQPKKKTPRRKPVGVGAAEFQAIKKPRLPHNSLFTCRYDAEKKLWHGTLSIPDAEETGGVSCHTFTGKDTGLFRLQVYLDDQYRAWLKEQPNGK